MIIHNFCSKKTVHVENSTVHTFIYKCIIFIYIFAVGILNELLTGMIKIYLLAVTGIINSRMTIINIEALSSCKNKLMGGG